MQGWSLLSSMVTPSMHEAKGVFRFVFLGRAFGKLQVIHCYEVPSETRSVSGCFLENSVELPRRQARQLFDDFHRNICVEDWIAAFFSRSDRLMLSAMAGRWRSVGVGSGNFRDKPSYAQP